MPNVYIISAPSGAGKTSLVKAVIEHMPNVTVAVSHTTRAPRPGETPGQAYHFVSTQTFQAMIEQQSFLEHAGVFDHAYGTAKDSVFRPLEKGQDVILEIDWQGARQVSRQLNDALSIYIMPPSKAILEQRLRQRGQDNEAIVVRRMQAADEEMSHAHEYDYCLINDDFETALIDLQSILRAQRLRQHKKQTPP